MGNNNRITRGEGFIGVLIVKDAIRFSDGSEQRTASSSGTVTVTAPITNSGTSSSPTIGIDTTNFPLLNTANTFTGGVQQITTAGTAIKALIIKGSSGQSANLQEWQNSSGTNLASIGSTGNFTLNGVTLGNPFGHLSIGTIAATPIGNATTITANFNSTTNPGVVLRAGTAHTANMQQWQNSAGSALSAIDRFGNFTKGDGDQLVLAAQVFG